MHETEAWPLQRAWPGLAQLEFTTTEGRGGRGSVTVHGECHAGVWTVGIGTMGPEAGE